MVGPNIDRIPEYLKEEGPDWHAIYNEAPPRAIDVRPRHTMSMRNPAFGLTFSSDGRLLAVAEGFCVSLFDTETGQSLCELKPDLGADADPHLNRFSTVCFSPDDNLLVASGEDAIIYIWEVQTRDFQGTLVGHASDVVSIVFQDLNALISASRDSTIHFWDMETRRSTKTFSAPQDSTTSMALSSRGSCLALSGANDVTVLNIADGSVVEKLQGHQSSTWSVASSRTGKFVASAGSDRTVRLWKLAKRATAGSEAQTSSPAKRLHTMHGHHDLACCVCWTPDGQWVLSGSKDRHVRVWDPKTGVSQAVVWAHMNTVTAICASPTGKMFATGGGDCRVRIWSYSQRSDNPKEAQREQERSLAHSFSSKDRPGLGVPINHLPPSTERFPTLVSNGEDDWKSTTLLIREVCMLKMMEDLTNKPEWWRKVWDPEIASRWKHEAMEMDWTRYRQFADFTPAMADACIAELREKANLYQDNKLIPVFDYSTCVIKSDHLSPDLFSRLQAAIKPLENVPADRKDWHPNSGRKVLDLVHPSLWPLIYGRTRVVAEGNVDIENCLSACGYGNTIAQPESTQRVVTRGWLGPTLEFETLSIQFQWLPCDVEINESGHTRIKSYINNLHPYNVELYDIINGFIQESLPAWDVIYRWHNEFVCKRLDAKRVGTTCLAPERCSAGYDCVPWNRTNGDNDAESDEDYAYNQYTSNPERAKLDDAWFDSTHPVNLPDATVLPGDQDGGRDGDQDSEQSDDGNEDEDEKPRLFCLQADDVRKSGFFGNASRIQVIVKLANIELTPEHPVYTGGSWHIEGLLNEHICASALFYYDSENITESRLAFRARCDEEELQMLEYQQNDHRSISRTFAINADRGQDTVLQDVGSVLTRQGRAVFFPNLLQHRVMPFSLKDRSNPGHRKILALFLVDPAIPIVSTANVPPQQPHWIDASRQSHVPVNDTIYEEEAKRIRLDLMSERSMLQSRTNEELSSVTFDFCEH
ncbi:hypothetical protein HIM_06817 [Hirsutella minnesotensis 3608]|uniref:Uncharacterized protein n=1 Tax=Hirsutella minnesotensis 3608 TaxID=1043627 RepID=A0A0F8A4J7_9HYPO|nr:hypothetical protein HIM_06817 [Hirsutella minnesotensis 3608]